MKSSNLLILIGVIVLLSGLLFVSIKSCNDKKVSTPSFTQQQIDSVTNLYDESNKVIASLVSSINKVAAEKDSIKALTVIKDRELEVKNIKIKALAKEAALYRQYNDTPSYIRACDSLVPQVNELAELSDSLRLEYKALSNSYDSLLSTNSLYIGRLQFDQEMLKEKFDKVSKNALALESENKRLDKKSSKRLILGPQAGATYMEGKWRPYGGFGVTWNLIRL